MNARIAVRCIVLLSCSWFSASAHAAVFPPSEATGCTSAAQMALQSIGITPRTLAAVDASDDQVEIIASVALTECASGLVDIQESLQRQEALAGEIASLQDHVMQGVATAAERNRLPLAKNQLSQVLDDRAAMLGILEDTVMGSLQSDQRAKILHIRNAKHVDVPLAEKVVSRTESEWKTLRDHLGDSQSSSEVSAAAASLAERGEQVASVWNATFGQ